MTGRQYTPCSRNCVDLCCSESDSTRIPPSPTLRNRAGVTVPAGGGYGLTLHLNLYLGLGLTLSNNRSNDRCRRYTSTQWGWHR